MENINETVHVREISAAKESTDTIIPAAVRSMQEISIAKESTDTIIIPAAVRLQEISNVKESTDTITPATTVSQLSEISPARRYILLSVFSLAQFLDAFNNASLFSAIPTMAVTLNMTGGQSFWLISAYQMLMASFLLISGRISDVYKPKSVFITGITGIVIFSVVGGFVQEKIGLIVLRAFLGICAALTIPSALALIMYMFPDPKAQAAAIGAFGGCGAIGNVLGLILGAILTQYASWRWCFYFVGIAAAPIAVVAFLLLPHGITTGNSPKHLRGMEKLLSLDLVGIFFLTAGLLLFTFALIQATTEGWVQAGVLVPLFLGVALTLVFFLWETKVPKGSAVVPPHIWSYTNFTLLFIVALLPYGFGSVIFTLLSPFWQDVFGWSTISFAVHALPLGVTAIFAVGLLAGPLSRFIIRRWFVFAGTVIMALAAVLLIFAYSPERYWSFVFHTLIWGCFGFCMVYMHVNVAVFRCTPSSMAGTVGAMFTASLQLGSALGVAIVTSIQQNVEAKNTGTDLESRYAGSAAAFEFYAALLGFMAIMIFVFYRNSPEVEEAKSYENQVIAEKIIGDSCMTLSPPEP